MPGIVDRGAPAALPGGADYLWLGIAVALALSLAYLFLPGVAGIAARWQEPEYSHGYFIPAIALFVLWRRRAQIRAAADEGTWAGVGVTALGLVLLISGRIAMSDIPQGLALLVILAGLALAAFGPGAMRWLWAPLALLALTLPVPAPLYVKLSTELQLISSEWGALLLRLLGISVFLDGNIIDLGVYKLQVAEACSGLRYLFPLASFGILCAWLYRAPVWACIVLVLSTAPITIAINSFRIALTGVFIEFGSVELAEGALHLFEGWVIFIVVLGLLFGEMWLLARLWTRRAGFTDLLDFDRIAGGKPTGSAPRARPRMRPPSPLVASLALLLLTVPVQAALRDRTEIIPERPGLATFPLRIGDWEAEMQPIEPEILESLDADDYLLADYRSATAAEPVNLWIAYYDSQSDGTWIHSPKECLPGGGWEFMGITPRSASVDGATFELNRAVIANGTERMLMYYWYEQRGRQITDEAMTRLYILTDSFALQRSDGALVRLLTPLRPDEGVDAAEARLASFLGKVYPQLEAHVGR